MPRSRIAGAFGMETERSPAPGAGVGSRRDLTRGAAGTTRGKTAGGSGTLSQPWSRIAGAFGAGTLSQPRSRVAGAFGAMRLSMIMAVDLRRGLLAPGLQDMRKGRAGIVSFPVALDDAQGARGADIQAGAHPVAKQLADKDGLVFGVELQGPFRASRGAQPAAVALVPIDLDDFSLGHPRTPFARVSIAAESTIQESRRRFLDFSQVRRPAGRRRPRRGRGGRGPR